MHPNIGKGEDKQKVKMNPNDMKVGLKAMGDKQPVQQPCTSYVTVKVLR